MCDNASGVRRFKKKKRRARLMCDVHSSFLRERERRKKKKISSMSYYAVNFFLKRNRER
jgi:hypothetical protein